MLLNRSKHIRFLLLNALVIALSLILIESKKEHAWKCMKEKCCSIDFSKMLRTVDYVLYVCGVNTVKGLHFKLYLDSGGPMDFLAYEPSKELDDTAYCGSVCDIADVCFKSRTFKVTADNNGTAEWCFEGGVIVMNETIFHEENICILFYNSTLELPTYLAEYMSAHRLW
ncbi:uncharacterized protein LOC114804627 [Zeugodacus cucurbitae]|uniref:Putative sodium-dependent excitatory amino acid transporter glt-4 n=1 Tax=Zeugodacus cucurbitae TaxID=28588 RepID=A0A0A1X5T2_ZEUCU|nr:uncharacterized protein LOC114804627 [Zeugodacus cucurbitae]